MLGGGGGCFTLRLSGCCGHIGHQSSHCDTVTSDLSHATKKHCAVHKALVSGRECANNTVHSNRISHPSGSLLSYLCTAPIRTVCIALLCYGNIIDVLYNEPIMFRVHKVAIDCLFIGNSTFDVQILPCFLLKKLFVVICYILF